MIEYINMLMRKYNVILCKELLMRIVWMLRYGKIILRYDTTNGNLNVLCLGIKIWLNHNKGMI